VLRFAEEIEDVPGVVAHWRTELTALLPEADVEHTGGSSLPGALTRGDVDLHVRVAAADFPVALAALEARFTAYYRPMWTPEFAAFTIPEEQRLPTGLVLTAVGGEHDLRFTRGWALLRARPELLTEYNDFKQRFAALEDEDGYRATKTAFFTRLESAA
jgi:GrpB-like predicted nucleotidyltransferase (UPF0157 family)